MQDGQELAAPSQDSPLGLERDPAYTEGSLRLPRPRGPAALCRRTDRSEARQQLLRDRGCERLARRAGEPLPGEAIALLRTRVADFAYGALTDDLCMLAARVH